MFLIEPKNGATVKNPITVKFGVEGMEVVPAGTDKPNSGHHHLLIDTKLEDYNAPIPADANHIHYGKAQTEAQIELSPGKHTLQDVFGTRTTSHTSRRCSRIQSPSRWSSRSGERSGTGGARRGPEA